MPHLFALSRASDGHRPTTQPRARPATTAARCAARFAARKVGGKVGGGVPGRPALALGLVALLRPPRPRLVHVPRRPEPLVDHRAHLERGLRARPDRPLPLPPARNREAHLPSGIRTEPRRRLN